MMSTTSHSSEPTPTGTDSLSGVSSDSATESTNPTSSGSNESTSEQFKKPSIVVGPRKGAHKFTKVTKCDPEPVTESDSSDVNIIDKCPRVPYDEPVWAGIPTTQYWLEVLKSGQILEKISLENKSHYVFGRLINCDVFMAHPTVSRHHAVIQYKAKAKPNEKNGVGFYVYDLGSTHGTFLNKTRVPGHKYIRMKVGHLVKLGLSSRMFILQGPSEDEEEESRETVKELMEKKKAKGKKPKDLPEDKKETKESEGIDWGMGEDADETTDLSVNPYAASQNEELYINDPKKSLRGWFEREGYELNYDCQEKGFAHFVCRVELPIDNANGQPIVAEAIVKGKKKEAVVQCAMEACRILDQHGMLRQATHESRKKKTKKWEENDFYDSDEDTFLDRTGTVEKKRQQRMEQAGVKGTEEVYTYASLLERHKKIVDEINRLDSEISSTKEAKMEEKKDEEEDELDKYISGLQSTSTDQVQIKKKKEELQKLRDDEVKIRNLANLAKPAGTPELKAPFGIILKINKKDIPFFGKRKFGLTKPSKHVKKPATVEQQGADYESDSD